MSPEPAHGPGGSSFAELLRAQAPHLLPGAGAGLDALFTPDWAALSDPNVWVAAYSQIFFSLSIAFGIMITYASYRKRKANLTAPGLVVAFANSSFEILAGIAVALKPRYAAYVVATWLGGIILSLLTVSGYYDVALRDFGLLLGALSLARLGSKYDAPLFGARS